MWRDGGRERVRVVGFGCSACLAGFGVRAPAHREADDREADDNVVLVRAWLL